MLYHNEISDQICIDFSGENNGKLPVAAAKACCDVLSAITECKHNINKKNVHPGGNTSPNVRWGGRPARDEKIDPTGSKVL